MDNLQIGQSWKHLGIPLLSLVLLRREKQNRISKTSTGFVHLRFEQGEIVLNPQIYHLSSSPKYLTAEQCLLMWGSMEKLE